MRKIGQARHRGRFCQPRTGRTVAHGSSAPDAIDQFFHRRLGEADDDGFFSMPCCEASTSTSQSCASMPRRMKELTLASTEGSVTEGTAGPQKRGTKLSLRATLCLD